MAKNDSLISAKPITPGTSFSASHMLSVNCTVAGNVEVTFENGDVFVFPVQVGYSAFPFAVTKVSAGGNTTATATYTRHY